ncbi:hypothetical protein OOT00_08440 [Desulfobotulus sp. H1]|uniref:Uncharacterized protein n=1 Tax=Desulfobotulus pelophilus TaxID=2823377 RepID=A0ABT3N985_9BACT|nr:hypothetical protein [Desulfobotulus pelophilus]MCW7754013.1 hypothetical protein [Desulfobotulus pelophilus]
MHGGICITTCRDGGLLTAEKGFRVLLGGRLGRHPRLGLPLPGLYSAEDLEKILFHVMDFWMSRPDPMERFSRMLQPENIHVFLP